ncbi:hypothetical protein PVAND_017578 [Polypedilum vanderplanki]|uniref:Uncharacterized protein n=1 Tax=Polypedilum vanderplanki TaxID=319348 RepID=A0A9J6BJF3_POLVA|nr:hypothetical protein PVAND_017578 [Polypedilum vanderplanki]
MVSSLKLDLTDIGNVRIKAAADEESFELIGAFTILNERLDLKLDDQLNLKELTELQIRVYRGDPGAIVNRMRNVKHLKVLNVHSSIESQFDYDSLVKLLINQNNLKVLELKVERFDKIFTEESVKLMKFHLEKFTLVPSTFNEYKYNWLNQFLKTQKNCLEELRVFSWKLQESINEGICNLENLKRLTTHYVPKFFETNDNDTNCIIMKKLTHFRYYSGNTSDNFESMNFDKTLPNLQCLNVHFGLDHRLFGHYPDVKVESNPLKNLKNLREFHIESHNQNLLHHLASSKLLTLATSCEDALYDISSWLQMGKTLPNLEKLIITNVDKRFLKFMISNHEKYVKKLRNLKTLILRDFDYEVINFSIDDGKVKKALVHYRINYTKLMSLELELWKIFEHFEAILLSDEEFDKKYEFYTNYFHQCGP